MHKRLFVLAERTGQRLQKSRGVDVALCEFFMVEAFGQRFVCLFFSQLDAELMRIGENGHGNRYEVMESSAAELRFFITRWIPCRPGFFLPVRVLSRLFRRLFLQMLEKAFDNGQLQFFSALQPLQDRQVFMRYLARSRKTEWVVYAKAPFVGPQQVLDYVGRYTHRVAISNNRLLDIEDGHVQFRYKDYRDDSQQKTMTLSADEFIRRFLLHVLPDGFHRIRYYGFLGNRYRQQKLDQCRRLMGMASPEQTTPTEQAPQDYRDRYQALTGSSLWDCPVCHRGRMVVVGRIAPCAHRPAFTNSS